jgi:hypothetical protein
MRICVGIQVYGGVDVGLKFVRIPALLFLALMLGCSESAVLAASGSLELVRDGRSEFSILVDASAGPQALSAIDTLRRYIREISGSDIPRSKALVGKGHQIVVEIGKSHEPNFSVADLGNDGFRIRTERGSLYFTAATDYGLQNAVYTFLESYLGCRKYSPTVTVVPKQSVIILSEINDTQVPQLTFRMQDFHDIAYASWHKLNTHDDFGLFVHTFRLVVPPEKYFGQHPEYFSLLNGNRTPNGQLCLTNPDIFRIVVGELRARMAAQPKATFWSVSQNDTYSPCECPTCRAIDSVEGSPSGSILAFVNRIADSFPDKTISTLAYQYSRSAPRHLKPRPNVNIMLCSIECNRQRPMTDDPGCASFVKDVEDWSKLTHNIFLWDYVIQFRNLVSPFPNLHVLQPNIQFFARNGIHSCFEQGLARMHGEFAELRAYLISKLLWNPDLNTDSVMNDFLCGYYGDAAPDIRRYIDTMRTALLASGEELQLFGYPSLSRDGYLSAPMMEVYDSLFVQAEARVKGQPEVLTRVQTAHLPVQFARLEQAKVIAEADRGCFVRDSAGNLKVRPEIDSLLTAFVARCKQGGIGMLWEHGTSPEEYLASTRAFFDGSTRDHRARGRQVILAQPASPKYHGGDPGALTDGFVGWNDYRFHWLGFEGVDMDATIDLGSVVSVSEIKTNFLQDNNSWVFMPLSVQFLVSVDDVDYRPVGTVLNSTPPEKDGAIILPFDTRFETTTARYIRVKAENMKMCPLWHKGAGGKAWIFIDEIRVL